MSAPPFPLSPVMTHASVRDRLQTSLGSAYALERELGGGGMSRVFVAHDQTLDRRVVVKVLSPELAQGLSAERFAREIKLAAALQNPHVVPLLAAGTTPDGMPYYTMPYVEGESLRARLAAGPVPLDEAVRVLGDMAEALEYAHAHGIVHRDIKPENVLLSGRAAVVADFGIAKAIRAAQGSPDAPGDAAPDGPTPGGPTLTSVGMSLGTPAYMAPEQAAGDPADHRADLYAWGMVAYELLAGTHPFAHRTSAAQLVLAQITEAPKPLDEVRPGLPPSLGAVVMRCLAKEPAERPRDAAEVLAALASLTSGAVPVVAAPRGRSPSTRRRAVTGAVLAAAVLAAAVLGAAGLAWRVGATRAADEAPSLAVLPFEYQGDTADAYLTDGITDEIRGRLTGIRDLVVIARASSVQYRATQKLPREIARELGVRYLLTGTARVVGSGGARRVLVRPELVEITKSDQPQSRWQQPFDAPAADVIHVQSAIAERVVGAMEIALGGADRARLTRVATRDPVAYDLYLRGQSALGGASDPISLKRAISFFEQAAARDSGSLDAWAALAATSSLLYSNGVPSPEVASRAREAAARVAALAPDGVERHLARGDYLRLVEGDLTGALEEQLLARRLDAGDAPALRALATLEGELGRFDDALRDYDASLRLDPLSAAAHANRARLLVRMRRLPEARAAAERVRALVPASSNGVAALVTVELAAGDLAAARRAIAAAMGDIPRDRVLAYVATYGENGWALSDEDQRHLLDLDESAYGGDRGAMAAARAQLYRWRGDSARARTWADSAAAALRAELRAEPRDAQRHVLLGLALAHAGRGKAAVDTAARGLALFDGRADRHMTTIGAYLYYVAAWAAATAGDADRALAWLRVALERRYFATPAWVRLEPSWGPLRRDPRLEPLLAEFSR